MGFVAWCWVVHRSTACGADRFPLRTDRAEGRPGGPYSLTRSNPTPSPKSFAGLGDKQRGDATGERKQRENKGERRGVARGREIVAVAGPGVEQKPENRE